jgi:hypothetical protein
MVAGTIPFPPPRGAEACRTRIAWSLHTELDTKAALSKSMTAKTQPLYNFMELGNGVEATKKGKRKIKHTSTSGWRSNTQLCKYLYIEHHLTPS